MIKQIIKLKQNWNLRFKSGKSFFLTEHEKNINVFSILDNGIDPTLTGIVIVSSFI
jgi:hypothetical protein